MKAIARQIRISPKKANLVAGLVRNKKAEEALNILKLTPKKGAKLLYKVLHSAVANAENNFKQKRDELMVKEIIVTKGMTLKRNVPISRGRVHPIHKMTSHITITVGLPEEKKKEEKPEKAETKKEKAEKPVEKTEKAEAKKAKSEKPEKEKTTPTPKK